MSNNDHPRFEVDHTNLQVQATQQTKIKVPSDFDRMSYNEWILKHFHYLPVDVFQALKEIRFLVLVQAGLRVHLCPDCYAMYDADTEHACDAT